MDASGPEWPEKHGPEFNRWNGDIGLFAALIKQHPRLWLADSQLKYLDIRVDTRNGHFIIEDRDGNRIEPERVMMACHLSTKKF